MHAGSLLVNFLSLGVFRDRRAYIAEIAAAAPRSMFAQAKILLTKHRIMNTM